ncbi:unnamed protein product [Clonostachys chloroleuca]|uniref:Uncharacterized protein n=1 Tax=Clonostachys chloroleuca TaxID=1926264 RepID=A0AA35M456_9HYPO|nr:unnamed protein product [Clonostachys chloroleuca]
MDSAVVNQSNDQAIYQATKDLFVGPKAKFRKPGPVRNSIKSYSKKNTLIRQYMTQYGAEAIHQTVLKLLSDGVYESTSIAAHRFPDLFEPSVAQTAARVMQEAEATRSEEVALENINQTEWSGGQGVLDWGEVTTSLHDTENTIIGSQVNSSSLFPVYLPFPKEHLLMEKLQKTLELACYEFGARALPDIMRRRGWDCPESTELSKWTELLKHEGLVELESTHKPLKELLHSIANIRHTAVHRLRTNSVGLERFLTDAEDFAGALGNAVYANAISQLRSNAESAFAELTKNKQFLQLRLEKTQAAIAKQRAELDRREQEAIDRVREEDEKYRMLAGESLEKALELMGDFKATTNGESAVLDGVDNGIKGIMDDKDDDMDEFTDCDE